MDSNHKYRLEVSDILSLYKEPLMKKYNLCPTQIKALEDITICRTYHAGGHVNICNVCHHKDQSFNSCRNRHCPKCQFIKQLQWVDKLKGRLIPGRYFHIVFTVPQELHPLFYSNQQKCYNVLFYAARDALLKAGSNSRFLGADVGAVAVLHTWGQTLSYHPHIHMLVPAGGLNEDGMEWITSPKKFFVPVKVLSGMFRGIMIKKLENMIHAGELKLNKGFSTFKDLKNKLYKNNWNVYSKKALGGINSLLGYLGRYTHRVAISNSRLIRMENGKVRFLYRDYKKKGLVREMELNAIEFARRFLQHILPLGFYKIRYVGILATVHIHTKREQVIALIGKSMWVPLLEGLSAYEVIRYITGKDPLICPLCKKGLMIRANGINQKE